MVPLVVVRTTVRTAATMPATTVKLARAREVKVRIRVSSARVKVKANDNNVDAVVDVSTALGLPLASLLLRASTLSVWCDSSTPRILRGLEQIHFVRRTLSF